MTMAYIVPKTVYSLAVMGTYLDLVDQDLPSDGDPLKILYAQRIGFFPAMTVVSKQEILDKINADTALAHIPLDGFLNGLIKNRLMVQAQTMIDNIKSRYRKFYRMDRLSRQSMLATSMDNRSEVYLPNVTMLDILSKLVEGTYNGSYLKTMDFRSSPYAERMREVKNELEILGVSAGEVPHAPFASTKFFPLLSALLSILTTAVEDRNEYYRFRIVPIVRTIYVLCRMFNGDIDDQNYTNIFATTSCDDSLFISDTTLAIMNGCTSETIRSLGIHERTQITRKGQFYLTACDCFANDKENMREY